MKNTFIKRNFVIFNVFAVLFCTVKGWRRMTIILTDSILSSARISRFAYSTHCPSDACADKCPLCSIPLECAMYSGISIILLSKSVTLQLYSLSMTQSLSSTNISGDRALNVGVSAKTWRI